MGFMDKVRNIMGAPEDEYEDEEMDVISSGSGSSSSRTQEEYEPAPETRRNKVVNIHATAQLQVVLVKPERFEDASSIADHLNAKRTVVLNLESTNKDVSRRLIEGVQQHLYHHPLQCRHHGRPAG